MDCERGEFADDTCWDNLGETSTDDYTCYLDGVAVETYEYQSGDDLRDQSYRGKYGSYEGGGYVFVLCVM